MYGMVNRALEEMVVSGWDEAAWERVKGSAGVDVEVFIGTEAYDDAVTYRLAGAASEVLGLPAGEVLRRFGLHWVLRTAREGYGDLLDAAGRDVREFLLNLPDFHTRVSLLFPHLSPPDFRCTDAGERSLRLHYRSARQGLTPFVGGLLEGIGEMFATPMSIVLDRSRSDGADHDEFLLSW